jgi:hypothetical protein
MIISNYYFLIFLKKKNEEEEEEERKEPFKCQESFKVDAKPKLTKRRAVD